MEFACDEESPQYVLYFQCCGWGREDTAAHDEELMQGRSPVLLPLNPTALGLNLHILKLSKRITAKTKSNGIKAWFGSQI